MSPNAEECSDTENPGAEALQQCQGRRILPQDSPASLAWVEYEELQDYVPPRKSPYRKWQHRRYPEQHKSSTCSKCQASRTKKVSRQQLKYRISKKGKLKGKTKFQQKKEKLVELLRPPYFTLTMIAINVLIYGLVGSAVIRWLEWSPGSWLRQPWRLLTYGLVHTSAAHLAVNSLMALAVGWRLEREQGSCRCACVWWSGVASGALGAAALQPAARVLGASAAVYAMLTAHLPNLCLRFGHIPLWWFRPLSIIVLASSEACWTLLRSRMEPPIALSNLSSPSGALSTSVPELDIDHVAWAAHAFGALVGVPIGFVFFTGENSTKVYATVCRIISVMFLTLLTMVTLGYYAYSFVAPLNTSSGI